jgi:hypothetical protein
MANAFLNTFSGTRQLQFAESIALTDRSDSSAPAHEHQLEQVVILNSSNERRGTIMSLKGAYTIDKHYYPEGGWAWVACACALYIQCIAQLLQWSALPLLCASAARTNPQIDPDTLLPVVPWPSCATHFEPIRPQLIQQLAATLLFNSLQLDSSYVPYPQSGADIAELDGSSNTAWSVFDRARTSSNDEWDFTPIQSIEPRQSIDHRWYQKIQNLSDSLAAVTNRSLSSFQTSQSQAIKSSHFIKSTLFNLSKLIFCLSFF